MMPLRWRRQTYIFDEEPGGGGGGGGGYMMMINALSFHCHHRYCYCCYYYRCFLSSHDPAVAVHPGRAVRG